MLDRLPLTIDPTSAVPPFEQLRTQIATQVAGAQLPAGTKLATVRQLAADLGLAAGTVARAYRELEADGVVVTDGRRGTFVRSLVLDTTGVDPAPSGGDRAARAAADYAAAARTLGLTVAEAQVLVERAWRP